MKFLFPLVLSALVLVGCNKLEGQLNVTTDLKLKSSKGETQLINVGTYTADLDKKSLSKKIVLRLNNDKDFKFEFKIPENAKIPSNGAFVFKSSEVGQNVDLHGNVNTKVTDSPMRDEFKSCTYQDTYTVCSPTGPGGQTVCQTHTRTVYGSQWVRYYDREIDQNVTINLIPVGATESSAEFSGRFLGVQRITVSETACR